MARVESQRFQILALDGGGSRGLFSAYVLARLEADLGCRLLDHFDLVVGTSAGGLLALGLGSNITGSDMVSHYEHLVGSVFNRHRRFIRKPVGLFGPMYSSDALREALAAVYGGRTMAESAVRLAIPAWDAEAGRIHVYKTPHHHSLNRDGRLSMADVGLATSAAPAYFGAAHVDSQTMLDGGVWANNPSVVGIAEAVGTLGHDLASIRVFNVGTTEGVVAHPRRLSRGGWLAWAPHATGLVLRAGGKGGQGISRQLLGPERYVRLDAQVPGDMFRLDSAARDRLGSFAATAARHLSDSFSRTFADHHAPPWLADEVGGAGETER